MELIGEVKRPNVSSSFPKDWFVIPLGDIFEFKNGLNKEKQYFGKGTPIVNYMDVFKLPGLVSKDIQGRVTLSQQEIKNYEAKKGDVFFTRTSETVDEIGISSVILENVIDTVFSGFVLRARPKTNQLSLKFKKFCFSSQFVRQQIISSASYTTRALTNGKLLSAVKLPLPPTLAEQEAIAEALSDADAIISSLEKLIAKKKLIKQGMMQNLLTPKEGWEKKKLGEVFEITAGGDLDKNNYSTIQNELFPYPIYSNALTNYGLYGFTSEYKQVENTITVSARGQIGVAFPREHKYTAIGRVLMLKPKTSTDIHFVSEFINKFIVFNNESTGVPQLTAPQISKSEIDLPSFEVQSHISQFIKESNNEILKLETKAEKMKSIKQGMMQVLLTGKVRLV